jgi:hypothetical protein
MTPVKRTINPAVKLVAASTNFTHRVAIIFYPKINSSAIGSKLKFTIVVSLLAGAIGPVVASERSRDEGGTLEYGAGVRIDYDSNIYDISGHEVESWIGVVMPVVHFSTAPERYSLAYKGEYGHFFEHSADNYDDHVFRGVTQFDIGSRGKAGFIVVGEKGHEGRGRGRTDGVDPSSLAFPDEPDEFYRNKWRGNFRYGAQDSLASLRFGFGGEQIDHTNNRERTQFYDYDTQTASVGLSLLFNWRTAIVLDAVFTDTRYETTRPGQPGIDSEDWRYLIGLTWAATSKTVGSVRYGIQQRRFDDPALAKISNPSWAVDLRWSPREYSHVDFVTSRLNEETTREGEFIDTIAYKVAWTHQWNHHWKSIVGWTRRDEKYVGAQRDQTTREFNLGLIYPQGRLLTWKVSYTGRSRDSNLRNLVYDGDLFSIGVNLSI